MLFQFSKRDKFLLRIIIIQYMLAHFAIVIMRIKENEGVLKGTLHSTAVLLIPFFIVSIIFLFVLLRYGLKLFVLCIVPFISIIGSVVLYLYAIYISGKSGLLSGFLSYAYIIFSKYIFLFGIFTLLPVFIFLYYNRSDNNGIINKA